MGEVVEWGQSLSECMSSWLYLLAGWVQAGKCTLSRERGREIGSSFLKTTQLKSPACAPSLTLPRHRRVKPGSCSKRASQFPLGRKGYL